MECREYGDRHGQGNDPSVESRLNHEPDEDRFADLTHILFDQAALAAGETLKDPASYVSRLNKLLLEMSA